MPVLQELSAKQIDEVIRTATERTIPTIITISTDDSWMNLHSRVLAVRGAHLLLELPGLEAGQPPHEFAPAERIGVSLKLKHHKHIFAGTVVGQERLSLEDGTEVPVLAVVMPTRMQRLQRRAFIRADVPDNRIVRASFWLGGCNAEPAGTSPEHLVWSGRVINLSAGGFQVNTELRAADGLEVGHTVGVRLIFGTEGQTIYADAQFRHLEFKEGHALMGFQFIGLTETQEGRVVLQILSGKVSDFQRAASKFGSFRQN